MIENHDIANIFPMMDETDFNNLNKDIVENGFDKERPIILYEDKILDGRNRYKACIKNNIEPSFTQYPGENPVGYVLSTNLNRRHLNASQRACISVKALPLFEAEAKKRQLSNLKVGDKIPVTPLIEEREKGEITEQAGKLTNTSRSYVAEAKRLQDESPEDFDKVLHGEKNISEVVKERKIQERKQKIAEQVAVIEQENIQKPTGDFDVIMIDPPWKVNFNYSPDHYMGRTANPYPEMTIDEIKQIQLPAKDDCILWLWTTHSQLEQAWDIMRGWGFEYKALLVWDKESMGIGSWLRKQCEFCLMGVKGKPIWKGTDVRDIIREARTSHSTKPEAIYNLIDENCVGRKLDYFARKKREGWTTFGDEVNDST